MKSHKHQSSNDCKLLTYDSDQLLHCVLRYPLHEIWYALCILWVFAYLLAGELLRSFYPREVFANHSNIFVKPRHNTWSAFWFLKFSNSCIMISWMPISQKIWEYSFWLVLNTPEIFSGLFITVESFISRHISSCALSEYMVLYSCKLFLRGYVGLKIGKNKILPEIFVFHF